MYVIHLFFGHLLCIATIYNRVCLLRGTSYSFNRAQVNLIIQRINQLEN